MIDQEVPCGYGPKDLFDVALDLPVGAVVAVSTAFTKGAHRSTVRRSDRAGSVRTGQPLLVHAISRLGWLSTVHRKGLRRAAEEMDVTLLHTPPIQ